MTLLSPLARSLHASERSGQFDLMMTRGGFPKARERARATRAVCSREEAFSHLQMGQKILEKYLHDRAKGERTQRVRNYDLEETGDIKRTNSY